VPSLQDGTAGIARLIQPASVMRHAGTDAHLGTMLVTLDCQQGRDATLSAKLKLDGISLRQEVEFHVLLIQ
jgi:hypothetical protein